VCVCERFSFEQEGISVEQEGILVEQEGGWKVTDVCSTACVKIRYLNYNVCSSDPLCFSSPKYIFQSER